MKNRKKPGEELKKRISRRDFMGAAAAVQPGHSGVIPMRKNTKISA